MVKVTAFLCEDTGQLFRYETDYLKHRRQYLSAKKANARIAQAKQNLQSYFDNLRLSINSLEDFENIFTVDYFKHCRNIMELRKPLKHLEFGGGYAAKSLYTYMVKHAEDLMDIQNKLEFSAKFYNHDQFSFKISNSHACPVEGVQNFGRDKSLPNGYPGIRGDLKLDCPIVDGYTITFGFDLLLQGLNLSNGAGGAGTYHYADISMFSADWPFLAKKQIIEALSLAVRNPWFFAEVKDLAIKFFPDIDLGLCYTLIKDQKLSIKDATLFIETVFDKKPPVQVLNIFHLASIKDSLPTLAHMFDTMMSEELKSEALPVLTMETYNGNS